MNASQKSIYVRYESHDFFVNVEKHDAHINRNISTANKILAKCPMHLSDEDIIWEMMRWRKHN